MPEIIIFFGPSGEVVSQGSGFSVQVSLYVQILFIQYLVTLSINSGVYFLKKGISQPRPYLPTRSSSLSPAPALSRLQTSRVNIVLALLNIDVRELIIADIIAASSKPRTPRKKQKGWGGCPIKARVVILLLLLLLQQKKIMTTIQQQQP